MKKQNNIIKTFSLVILLVMSAAAKAQTQVSFRKPSAENKVAILPMIYIGEGNEMKLEQMRYSLQNIAHRYLREDAIELKFQDPSETNAILLKHGVTESTFRQFTPKELVDILNVEYVLVGMVSQESQATITTTNTHRSHETRDYRRHGTRDERNSNTNTRTREDINTTVDLSVYNDKGEQIYSRSRKSLLSDLDTYKAGLQYLLKRTPLYKR